MKPVDVNPSMYIHFNKGNNKEGPEFKVGNHVRISKYKDIFAKSYFPIWSKKVFVIPKDKKNCKKVINRKDNKWKCYDNSFNSWIDKKDVV